MTYAEKRDHGGMIPGKIIRFLEERANIGFAGTRDARLVPCGHRVSAWQVDPGGRRITVCVPASSEAQLVGALLENGAIALTFEEVGAHETYQLKGRYLGHRPVHAPEMDIAVRLRERLGKTATALYPDARMAAALKESVPPPGLAVEIEVHEVFVQTPGPDAGTRIAPPVEAAPGKP